jgi:hypothetical protein
MNMHQWQQEVLERDDYMCQWPGCGKNTTLDAAHILSRRQAPSMQTALVNGVTLCRGHHEVFHRNRAERERFIAILMDQRVKGYALVNSF